MTPEADDQYQQRESLSSRLVNKLHLRNISSRVRIFIFIVSFSAVGVVATMAIFAADARREETVLLSNGQKISLGDPITELDKLVGDQSAVTNDKKIYQYPFPTSNEPVEVLIYTDQVKVMAIQIINDEENRIVGEEKSVNLPREIILQRLEVVAGRRSNSRIKPIGETGYRFDLRRSSKYFLTEPCSTNKEVQSVVLAYKEAENLFGANDILGCDSVRD